MVTVIAAVVVVGVAVLAWRWVANRLRMWPHVWLVASLLTAAACMAPVMPPVAPENPTPSASVAVLTVTVTPVPAVVTVAHEDGRVIRGWATRADGTVIEEFPPGVYRVSASAAGYVDSEPVLVTASGRTAVAITLQPVAKVQWCDVWGEDRLRSVRADLGGVRLSFETNAARRTNYFFSPSYVTKTPEQRAIIRAEYKARGYTHFIVGPIYERGYHDWWPGHDFREDVSGWVAIMEELWQDDLAPWLWVFPDGPYNLHGGYGSDVNPPDFDKARRELLPVFQHPEMQRVHCNVTFGWEVTDNGWVKTIAKARHGLEFLRDAFPTAYRYWHGSVDNGAPCNYDEDGYGCEGDAWRTLTPLIHGYFWQTGAAGGWNLAEGRDPANRQHRIDQFIENLKYEINRFHGNHYRVGGLTGADGKLIDIIAGEYSAYFELNDGESEEWGRSWGALALTFPGVRGFGDGGPGGNR
jgi:hypothetical protein